MLADRLRLVANPDDIVARLTEDLMHQSNHSPGGGEETAPAEVISSLAHGSLCGIVYQRDFRASRRIRERSPRISLSYPERSSVH
jgi:hypothetical protein